ncbi:MAG: TetR/AcrR family transcriptional regulator [Acidimicrobiia bacterium]
MSPPKTKRNGHRQLGALARVSPDERRERILEAAREVFIASGLKGARTKDISERAGVAEGLIFKHFENKEGLFEAAVTVPLEAMLADVVETAKSMSTSSPEDRIAASEALHVHLLRTMLEVTPLLGLGLFSDRARGEGFYRDHIAPLIEESSRVVAEAMAEWAHPEPDPRFVFLVMWGTHLALALDASFQDRPIDIDTAARELTALLSRSYSQAPRKAGTSRSTRR